MAAEIIKLRKKVQLLEKRNEELDQMKLYKEALEVRLKKAEDEIDWLKEMIKSPNEKDSHEKEAILKEKSATEEIFKEESVIE